jgi:hypothetical protein
MRCTVRTEAAISGGAWALMKAIHLAAIRRVGNRKALVLLVPDFSRISAAKAWTLLWMKKLGKHQYMTQYTC